ncbi:hypothetical protein KCG44_09190 [Pacificimonas sp. WHA3]|uniref:Uncharacterized protein n=1 Tax=Pacificimonas pallii TaxID=2827236 RepID=A0ABS6SEX1_9SPHN|nr:hypothetical protein [Pacificimonas pallii]MBV7256955.1 hypothetical protein [Pacificimonas pallii]
MTVDTNYLLNNLAAAPSAGRRETNADPASWYEALAHAWGNALDNQATRIEVRAEELQQGADSPSQITMLTAESLRMSFMAQSSSTSTNSVGESLQTMARKN